MIGEIVLSLQMRSHLLPVGFDRCHPYGRTLLTLCNQRPNQGIPSVLVDRNRHPGMYKKELPNSSRGFENTATFSAESTMLWLNKRCIDCLFFSRVYLLVELRSCMFLWLCFNKHLQ
jgi:hypothetical protein